MLHTVCVMSEDAEGEFWLWPRLVFSCEAEEQSSPFLSNSGVGELAVFLDIGFVDIFSLCLWVWIGDCVGAESRLSADRVVKLLLISIYIDDANKSMILAWDQIRLPGNVNIKDHNLETKLFYDILCIVWCELSYLCNQKHNTIKERFLKYFEYICHFGK